MPRRERPAKVTVEYEEVDEGPTWGELLAVFYPYMGALAIVYILYLFITGQTVFQEVIEWGMISILSGSFGVIAVVSTYSEPGWFRRMVIGLGVFGIAYAVPFWYPHLFRLAIGGFFGTIACSYACFNYAALKEA